MHCTTTGMFARVLTSTGAEAGQLATLLPLMQAMRLLPLKAGVKVEPHTHAPDASTEAPAAQGFCSTSSSSKEKNAALAICIQH
jgi:hypothetical protein